MATKCLICDEAIPESHGVNAPVGRNAKKSRSEGGIPILSDSKAKFALTHSQYTILQRVLSLPTGACRDELILGPYCRDCFTNINNVCHCMSALENLQQSVIEFRKDFGSKMQKSCGAAESVLKGARKRKSSLATNGNEPNYSTARSTILDCLSNSVFTSAIPDVPTKPKHIHEIISNMDPGGTPDTHVDADQVVCTTNGTMPVKRAGTTNLSKKKTAVVQRQVSASRTVGEDSRSRLSSSLEKPEFLCGQCQQYFFTNEELLNHESVAHQYKCTICPKGFSTPKAIKTHIQMHTKKKSKNKFFPKKSKSSLTKDTTNEHSSSTTPSKVQNNVKPSRPGRCKVCSKIVMDFQSHMRQQHPEFKINHNLTSSEDSTKVKPESKPEATNLEKTWKTRSSEVITPSHNATGADKLNFSSVFDPKKTVKTESSSTTIYSNELKTEREDSPKKSNSLAEASLSPSSSTTQKPRPACFQIPPMATLPSPPQPQVTANSKYQFKNLLKIGDEKP